MLSYWKDEEVEALVNALEELASDPLWKVDGGFKSNYMGEVHRILLRKIPNFDKEVNPHIDSKIKWLRTKYNSISEMCMQSGFQWDDVEHKINCEKQWFDEWCMNHKNASGLWNFKFPYLRKLDLVWGRDRATGLRTEDIARASVDSNPTNDFLVCSSSDSEGEFGLDSDAQGSPGSSSSVHTSKKRKKLWPRRESFYNKKPTKLQHTIDAGLGQFTAKLKSICNAMSIEYASAAKNLTTEPKVAFVPDEKMQEVINELINLDMSSLDVGRAVEVFGIDPNKVRTLFLLPSHLRKSYVLGILSPPANP